MGLSTVLENCFLSAKARNFTKSDRPLETIEEHNYTVLVYVDTTTPQEPTAFVIVSYFGGLLVYGPLNDVYENSKTMTEHSPQLPELLSRGQRVFNDRIP